MWWMILPITCAAVSEPVLEVKPLENGRTVQVIAQLPEDVLTSRAAAKRLRFSLIHADQKLGPPILGKYEKEGQRWIFTPRYPLAYDQNYRATLLSNKTLTKDYRTPKRKPGKPPRVLKIYPSADELPENHLKFYLYFSKPMREGREIFDRIHLLNSKGLPIEGVWRRTELWSENATRLTLWIHPGRVKTGVNLREEEGPVLIAGEKYQLVIGANLEDAQGNPMGGAHVKNFQAIAPDHETPQPAMWKITLPKVGTREPVQVRFGEALDYALLFRFLEVHNAKGQKVQGTITVGKEETTWNFQPKTAWEKTEYQIQIDGMLEDLAGNTPVRIFDTDLSKPKTQTPKLALPFNPDKRNRSIK